MNTTSDFRLTRNLDPRRAVIGIRPVVREPSHNAEMRARSFRPPRRRWPGILAAGVVGAGIAAAALSSFYDDRTIGERLDASVQAGADTVHHQVDSLKAGAAGAARNSVAASDRVVTALGDTGITAAVKTALAADPSLSAVKIDVSTQDGVVSLAGPAPDVKSRDRAEVLAAAPDGVRRVDNRLVVVPPATTTN